MIFQYTLLKDLTFVVSADRELAPPYLGRRGHVLKTVFSPALSLSYINITVLQHYKYLIEQYYKHLIDRATLHSI